jgi:hypothetical protein
MKSYSFHFDCGNSDDGPVGFCARVRAESPQEALTILRQVLPETAEIPTDDDRVEYLNVYFGPENVLKSDIDMVDDDVVDIYEWEQDDGEAQAPDLHTA